MAETDLEVLKQLLTTPELPELGPGPRAGVQPESALNAKLAPLLARRKISEDKQELIRALVLLWHDHLEPAHILAQNVENPDGSLVHAIMHRREPDYGNAKYWFRRVGDHQAFPQIAERVGALVDSRSEKQLRRQLIQNGRWSTFDFVDVCEEANRKSAPEAKKNLLREIQAIETQVLLELFWNGI